MKLKILAGVNIAELPKIYYDFENKLLYDNLIKLNKKEKYIETKNFEIKIIKNIDNYNEFRKEITKTKPDVIYGFDKIEKVYLLGIVKFPVIRIKRRNYSLIDFVNDINKIIKENK